MYAVKFADGRDDLIEGPGIPFGGPFKFEGKPEGQDLYGEHFSPRTNLCLDWFPESRPLLYHHGLDKDAGTSVVGRCYYKGVRDGVGHWVQGQLDKSSEYFDSIREMVAAGKLFFSSGAMGHLVETDKRSGEILTWPWVELSLTPTPANLLATVTPAAAKAHLKACGLDVPSALKAVLDAAAENDLADSDFAYVDKDGGRHLPINDKGHVQSALARFNQTKFESEEAKDQARKKVLAAAKREGIEVSDETMRNLMTTEAAKSADLTLRSWGPTLVEPLDGSYEDLIEDIQEILNRPQPWASGAYWRVIATFPSYVIACQSDWDGDDETYFRIAYTVGANGEPMLGAYTRVEPTFVPVAPDETTSAVPLGLQAAWLGRQAVALVGRTEDLNQRRIKEGRVLSDANRQRLARCAEAMEVALTDLKDLISSTEVPAKAADVRRLATAFSLWAAANTD